MPYGDFSNLALTYAGGEYTVSSPDGMKTVFDARGLMLREEDRQGNQRVYDYFTSGEAATAGNADLEGRLEKIIEPDGTYVALGYNGSEEVVTLTDSHSRVTTLTRASGQITAITYPDPDAGGSLLAPRVEFAYNGDGQVSTRKLYPTESNDSGAAETDTFTYDGATGRIATVAYSSGLNDVFEPEFAVGSDLGVDASDRAPLVKAADAYGFQTTDGAVTRTKYNQFGQTLEVVRNWIPTTPNVFKENLTTTYEYYNSGDGVSALVVGKLKLVISPDPDGPGTGEAAYETEYEYFDATGLLHTIFYPDDSTEVFLYGTSGGALNLVTQRADRMGRLTIFTYDADGNRTTEQRVVDEPDDEINEQTDDVITTWEYGSTGANIAGLPTAMIDPRGMRTEYSYNTHGLTTEVIVDVGGLDATTTYSYNGLDQLIKIVTPLGQGVSGSDYYFEEFAYDGLGRLVTNTKPDPDGAAGAMGRAVYTYTYDRENRRLTAVDPLNRLTTYVYQTDGSYSVSLPDHDANGYLTTTTYVMDGRGRLAKTIDPMYFETVYAYDDMDRRISVTLPKPDIVYNANGTIASNPDPGIPSPQMFTSYDALSRPVTTTDAMGSDTHYFYSDFGRTVEVWQPSPGGTQPRPITITKHNADGSVHTVTEGSVPYDADPEDAHIELGQPDHVPRTLLRWTRYEYDDLGRVIEVRKTLPDASSAPSCSNDYLAEQMAYDKNGNVLTSTLTVTLDGGGDPDQVRTTTFVYDLLNRNTQRKEQDPDANDLTDNQPVWNFVYDVENRLTKKTDPLGKTTDLGYDRVNQLRYTTLPDPDGGGPLGRPLYTTYYDLAGRVTKEKDPLDHYTAYVYDVIDNQTWDLAKDSSDNELSLIKYGFDANNRLRYKNEKTGTYIHSGNTYNTYALTSHHYDNLGNLIRVDMPDPDDPSYVEGPLSYTNTGGSQGRPLLRWTYDANGNQVSEINELTKTTTFVYDTLNRLTSRTDPDPDGAGGKSAPVTSYTYDVFNNRTSLTDPDGNETSWTYDLWGRVLTETNELNETRTFTYDLQGNVLTRTDRNGRVIT